MSEEMIDKLEKLMDAKMALALLPIERRLDALEAGEPEQEPEPPAPDRSGSLVELVSLATEPNWPGADWVGPKSRAAIRAVADWLEQQRPMLEMDAISLLRAELEREP